MPCRRRRPLTPARPSGPRGPRPPTAARAWADPAGSPGARAAAGRGGRTAPARPGCAGPRRTRRRRPARGRWPAGAASARPAAPGPPRSPPGWPAADLAERGSSDLRYRLEVDAGLAGDREGDRLALHVHLLDLALGLSAVGARIGHVVADQTHGRAALGAGAHVGDLLERRELGHLAHEVLVLDRVQRVL